MSNLAFLECGQMSNLAFLECVHMSDLAVLQSNCRIELLFHQLADPLELSLQLDVLDILLRQLSVPPRELLLMLMLEAYES